MTSIEKMRDKGIIPTAALYARFSSDNQREESIEAQLRAIHEFCERNGIVVVGEYCDRAKSATTDDRPEFLHLVADSKDGSFNFVIVHKLDRFSRNRYDSAYYKRELKKNGVTLISVLEHMDDSPESVILESVLEGMSEYYSKNLAREVMKGMKESALQCKALGGRPPFGYQVNKQTRLFEINEEEADGVRLIFDRVANGVGYSEVLTELNNLGYRTRLGNPFGKNSLNEILRNERYKGIYIFNRAASHNTSNKRNNHASKSLDEMIRIPGGMPAIISEEAFDRVQAILSGRRQRSSSAKAKEPYLLAGKIVCGECGTAYVGTRRHGGRNKSLQITYTCCKKHNHGSEHCRNKDINRNYIEDFVLKRISEVVFDEKRIPELIAAYQASAGELSGESEKKIKRLTNEYTGTSQKIDNIVSVIAQTGSPALLSTLNELEQEKQRLALQIESEKDNLTENLLDREEIVSAYRTAQKQFRDGTLPQKQQLLNLYLKKVIVYPEYLEIQLNNVPGAFLKPGEIENGLPTENDEQPGLHIYQNWAQKECAPTLKSEWTRISVVEARGVEPNTYNHIAFLQKPRKH